MERLRKQDAESGAESRPLTDEQRTAIAEVRNFYEAKAPKSRCCTSRPCAGRRSRRARRLRGAVPPRPGAPQLGARPQDRTHPPRRCLTHCPPEPPRQPARVPLVLSRFFQVAARGSSIRREVLGGTTTFVAMAYIIVVNPAILHAAGIPRGPGTVATILTAAFGSLLMGLYANRPIAVAPYMGENAFIAFGLVALGATWEQRLGSVFVAGVVFLLLTVFQVRAKLANAISPSLKYSFAQASACSWRSSACMKPASSPAGRPACQRPRSSRRTGMAARPRGAGQDRRVPQFPRTARDHGIRGDGRADDPQVPVRSSSAWRNGGRRYAIGLGPSRRRPACSRCRSPARSPSRPSPSTSTSPAC